MVFDVVAAHNFVQRSGVSINWETREQVEQQLTQHLGRAPTSDEFKGVLRRHFAGLATEGTQGVIFKAETPKAGAQHGMILALRAGGSPLGRALDAFIERDRKGTEGTIDFHPVINEIRLKSLLDVFKLRGRQIVDLPEVARVPSRDGPDDRNVRERSMDGHRIYHVALQEGDMIICPLKSGVFAVDLYKNGTRVGGRHDMELSQLGSAIKQQFFDDVS